MPIYAYRCQKCGSEEEHLQKLSDEPKRTCERCGGKLVKQMTAAAFRLKGGGWYKDGYASSPPPDKGEGGSKSEGQPAADHKGKEAGTSSTSGANSGGTGSSEGSGTKATSAKGKQSTP